MALLAGEATAPLPATHAACPPRPAAAAVPQEREQDCDTTPQLTQAERWVTDACRVELDKDGNVLTHIPALMAGAVARLVEAAAACDAARGSPHATVGTAPPPFAAATRLHGCRPPGISVEAYAGRLLRYARCSPVCFVAAFAYMRRLQTGGGEGRGGPLRLDGLTAHRLMATGLVIATKFCDDKYYSNGHYAQVAGVSLRELNAMELDLLFRLGFRARCSLAELSEALAEMQSLAGGWAGHSPMLAAAAGLPGAAAPAAAAEAAGVVGTASGAARAAAAAAEELDESCSVGTTAGLAAASAGGGDELGSCGTSAAARLAASAPLPWAVAPAAAAAAAAEGPFQGDAPSKRSKKRCSVEAQHGLLRGSLDERQHYAEPLCRA